LIEVVGLLLFRIKLSRKQSEMSAAAKRKLQCKKDENLNKFSAVVFFRARMIYEKRKETSEFCEDHAEG
jgi:hypothetical protein